MVEEKNEKNPIEIEPILQVEKLVKSYGKRVVVNELSFIVNPGECYCLFGKNGIGKSTTLDCIVGLKTKNDGIVKLDGLDLDKDPINFKLNLGYVPSEPILYEMMTGEEYLKFIGSSYQMIDEVFHRNYQALLIKFDMPESDMKRRISEYSHGMKQKVALMASIIHNPDLWVLDEPTVGLDIMVYKTLVDVINDFKRAKKGILIVSHSIDFIFDVATKACLLNNGVIQTTFDLTSRNPYLKTDMRNLFFSIYKGDKK